MRVAIIEDEPISATELVNLVKRYNENIRIDPVLDTVKGLIRYLKKGEPDLLFLDIELADGISFEIFDHVEVGCPIVFTTAYDQYALKAFEQNSISYLLKPITFDNLKAVFEKYSHLRKVFKEDIDVLTSIRQPFKENFLVRSGKKLIPMSVDDIAYFNSEDNITYLVALDGKKYLSGNTLYELEALLDPIRFLRVNRQILVSRDAVSHLESYAKGQVRLYLKGTEAGMVSTVISREKTPVLKEWLS